ncbi:MAG: hypothetical protein WCO42_05775 [bacterium]
MRELSKILGGVWAGLGLVTGVTATPAYDYGCLASAGRNLHHQDTARGLGPIFERSSRGGTDTLTAVRPFFVSEWDPTEGKKILDVLWPVGHIRHWNNETDWRFLTAFYHDPDAADPASAYRFWILPLVAMGRDKTGEDYGAVFPLGGRIDDWFGRDRVEFVLFPLYWHSELKDIRTDHYLWPLISRTTGDDLSRFRVFPFYGRSEKKGEGESRFILWPFWTTVRYDHPGARGSGFMLFPVYGHSKTERSESWMFLPPFFRHTAGKTGTENIVLWPFIQTEKSPGHEKFYVWPLYGRRTTERENRRFWLWPLIWNRTESLPAVENNRFTVFPVFHSESSRLKKDEDKVIDRYVSVWPLCSYERIRDGARRVRVPDLWPFRNTAPIERNLTPWWTLYKYERTPVGRENDFLRGLVHWGAMTNGAAYGSFFPLASWGRDDADGKHKSWDFLKGMLGYRHDESGKVWQMLYFIHWRVGP